MRKKFSGPVIKLAFYLGLVWFTFWQPVIVIFWLKNGLTMSSIMILKSLHGIAVLLLEVPTGVITDRFGARTSFIFASILYVLSLIVYVFGHSFSVFLVAELIAAFGTALVSGSDSAYVYTLLNSENKSSLFSDIFGKINSVRLLSQTVAGILGGFVAQFISLRATLALTIIPNAASIFVAISLPNVKVKVRKGETILSMFGRGVRSLFAGITNMRLSINYITIATAGLLLFWIYQPYLKKIGVPLAYFGILMAVFNFTAMSFSSFSGVIRRFLGATKSVLLINLLFIFSALFMGFAFGPQGAIFILGLQAVRGMQPAIFHELILNNTDPDSRATSLSILNMMKRASFVAFAPILGVAVDKYGVFISIRGIALFVAIVITGVFVLTAFVGIIATSDV